MAGVHFSPSDSRAIAHTQHALVPPKKLVTHVELSEAADVYTDPVRLKQSPLFKGGVAESGERIASAGLAAGKELSEQFSPTIDAEALINAFQMVVYGVIRQRKLLCDLLDAIARKQLK